MSKHRIYTMAFGKVYPAYIAKAEKKGRTKAEVDEIIRWLTGYSQEGLDARIADGTDLETFFDTAPAMNPAREMITGVICGVRVEEIEEKTMREIRYLDKLVDELAKGKKMEKILRRGEGGAFFALVIARLVRVIQWRDVHRAKSSLADRTARRWITRMKRVMTGV